MSLAVRKKTSRSSAAAAGTAAGTAPIMAYANTRPPRRLVLEPCPSLSSRARPAVCLGSWGWRPDTAADAKVTGSLQTEARVRASRAP